MLWSRDAEITVLMKANYPLIALETWEEVRVLRRLEAIAKGLGRTLVTWSITEGFQDPQGLIPKADEHTDPMALDAVLRAVRDYRGKAVFVLRDFHPYLPGDGESHPAGSRLVRALRDLARDLPTIGTQVARTVVFLGPSFRPPADLIKDLVVLSYPLPDRQDLLGAVDTMLREATERGLAGALDDDCRLRLAEAVKGLTQVEAENALYKAAARFDQEGRTLGADSLGDAIRWLLEEKEQIVRRSGVLEYYRQDERFDQVGGLDNLKRWLRSRRPLFSEQAALAGLDRPKGALLLGLPGTGKSMTAKAIASEWSLPLLRLDVGALFHKYVGDSEANMRRALQTAEAISPCVLWVDEIEKAFSGIGSDSTGVTTRVFGTFLTWMQEQRAGAFVVATANDVTRLPPELMRKGRFDEMFFIDLPQRGERVDILRKKLASLHETLRPGPVDEDLLARECQAFSGAEIESAVKEASVRAYGLGRRVTEADLLACVRGTRPLSATFREKLDATRTWAARCVPASAQEPGEAGFVTAGIEPLRSLSVPEE